MRVLCLLLGVAAAVLGLVAQCGAEGSTPRLSAPQPAASQPVPSAKVTPPADSLVRGMTEFGLALYKDVARGGGNVVLSPLSVSIATAMLDAGAEGKTRAEIAAAARFGLPEEALHKELEALLDELLVRVAPWAKLSFANGIWVDSLCTPSRSYERLLAQCYGALPQRVRFGQEPEESSARINEFVSERTHGKIASVVTPDMFTDLTRLVLVNAVYFLGAWDQRFWQKETKEEPFRAESGATVPVSMMHQTTTSGYYEDDTVQVLELPYQGSGLAMLVVLPRSSPKLADLEAKLSVALLSDWRRGLTRSGVDVKMPRFEVAGQIDLVPLLKSMGMKRVFIEGRAELPGLCNRPNLYVDLMSHAAALGINEKGTEAAAATVYRATEGIESPPRAVVSFHADRPFMFIVQDTKRGTILFMGRCANPGK